MKARKNIAAIPAYVAGKATENKKIIKLNSNECPFEPPCSIYRRASRIRRINRYHEASGLKLRELLGKELGLSAQSIVLGNGSGELIKTYLEAFVAPNQNVVIPAVTFSLYKLYAMVYDINIKSIDLSVDLRLELEQVLDAIDGQTAALFLVNPNNPTGECFSYNQLQSFFSKVPAHVGIFLDEAYIHYVDDQLTFPLKDLLAEFPNLFVLRTFSKVGLAGVRLGYGMGNPELVDVLHKVRPPFNTNVYAQELGCTLLDEKKYLDLIKWNNFVQKAYLEEGFRQLGIDVFPSESNFLLIKSQLDLSSILEKRGILIRSAQSFGLSADHYRITIGTPQENKQLMTALKEVTQCSE